MKKYQTGYNMVELMLVMVIIALLGIPSYVVYKDQMASGKVEAESIYVKTLSAGIRKMNMSSSDFSSISAATLIPLQKVPAKMVSGSGLVNTWGGTVTLSGTSSSFSITENAVPVDACIDFVTNVQVDFQTVTVGGAAVKTNGTFTKANADTACGAAPTTTIVFTGS